MPAAFHTFGDPLSGHRHVMPNEREEEVPEDRKLAEQGNTDAKLFVPDDTEGEDDEDAGGEDDEA